MVTTVRRDPGAVLFGATRRRLLGWLFGHPDEAFYLRDLLRRTGAPEGAAQRELSALTAAGIVTRERRGNQVFFQANRASPVFVELSSLMTKTTGIAAVLRDAMTPLATRIRVAFLHGFAARNALRHDSDIDLMVVGDVTFGEVVDALVPAQSTLGREINPTVYPTREFVDKRRTGSHFVTAVMNTPLVFLLGDRDDLERLGGESEVARLAYDVEAGGPRPARRGRSKPARQRRRRTER